MTLVDACYNTRSFCVSDLNFEHTYFMDFLKKVWNFILKVRDWFLVCLGILLILFVIYFFIRLPHNLGVLNTRKQVEKIHNIKLTLDDVAGKNLPPDPSADADKTVQGIDANSNGIRDDVELAIFKEYPNFAKTRAVLLQYALALQMEFIQPMVNKDIVVAVISEQSRAYDCIGDTEIKKSTEKYSDNTDNFINFIKSRQFNTQDRKNSRNNFLEFLGSYSELGQKCDIDLSSLAD